MKDTVTFIYSHTYNTNLYRSLIYLSSFDPQVSMRQQKASCLHPVLRLETDVAA